MTCSALTAFEGESVVGLLLGAREGDRLGLGVGCSEMI